MLKETYTIAEFDDAFRQIAAEVVDNSLSMSEDRFYEGSAESWSGADYLKHLILSVKPFAKGLNLPRERLAQMFGTADRPSLTSAQFVERYDAVIAAGARAEMNPAILPVGYRIPEGVSDTRDYLLETWRDAAQRVSTALESWSEEDLDRYQMPHPAVGDTTIREWLYFMVHHTGVHSRDIAGRAAH